MYDSFSRDAYDLHYHRYLPQRLVTPRGTVEEQPNDPDFDEITDLENALNGLVKKRNILLNQESQNLKSILDEALFYFERLKVIDPVATLGINPDAFQRRGCGNRRDGFNELDVLDKRTTEAMRHRDTLQRKLKASVAARAQSFQGVKGENQDVLLYRIQTKPSSHAQPTGRVPFISPAYRSSGWDNFDEITNDSILRYLNETRGPKLMISLQESPADLAVLLKRIADCSEGTTTIEVFSLRMLQHIGVLLARSTDLCQDRLIPFTDGNNAEHAQDVRSTHWLVMHWVPKEAVVSKLRVYEFLALARDRGVIDNITNRNVLDTGYSVRFSIRDFPADSLVDIKPSLRELSDVSRLPAISTSLNLSSPNKQDEAVSAAVATKSLLQSTGHKKSQETSKYISTGTSIGESDILSETSDDLVHTPGSWIDTPPPELFDLPRPTTPPQPSGSKPEQSETSNSPQRTKSVIPQLADVIPSVFGKPTPLTPRHRNIKSPFTATIDPSPKGFFATEATPFGCGVPPQFMYNSGGMMPNPSKAPGESRTPSVFQAIGRK